MKNIPGRLYPGFAFLAATMIILASACPGRDKARKEALEKVKLGETLLKVENFEQAEQYFQQAIDLEDGLVDAHRGLGIALCRTGRVEQGIKALERALELEPKDSKSLMARGICQEHQADAGLAKAIASYTEAIELDPENPMLHNQLGVAFQKTGEHRKAVDQFQKALEIDPRLFVAYNNLGTSLVMLGEYDQAISLYQEGIKRHPDLTGLYFYTNLGIAFLYKNNLERAESAFLMETAINPEHLQAHLNLGNIYTVKGDYQKAVTEYSRVLALEPDSHSALINLAIVYLVMKKPGQAKKHLEHVLEVNPEDGPGHYYLGKAHSLLGNKEMARKEYERAISLGFSPPASLNSTP